MRPCLSGDSDFCVGGFAREVAGIYGDELGLVREKVRGRINIGIKTARLRVPFAFLERATNGAEPPANPVRENDIYAKAAARGSRQKNCEKDMTYEELA